MAERLSPRLRPTGMWMRVLVTVVVLPLLVAGCGDNGGHRADTSASKASVDDCLVATLGPRPSVSADLDGDGTAETVEDVAGTGTGSCAAAYLEADVGGRTLLASVPDDLELAPHGMQKVTVPSRTGELVLLTLRHPRGGFQAHLYGFADGRLEELTVAGQPIFPFVATDTPTDPMSATCTDGGFEITTARAHEPIGVVPAWDIDRTTYTVDGNTVTKGETTEIADNVLDKQLHRDHRQLTHSSLFANCRVGH